MKLYFARRTRATRPRWLLEELGVPYELVTLDLGKGEHKTPEYLAIHPLGVVPALVDGDATVLESAAICLYLAEKFADRGLAPAVGTPERAAYLSWIMYAQVTLEPTITRASAKTPEAGAREAFVSTAMPLERAVAGKSFLVGDRMSAADVVVGAMVSWAGAMKLLDELPALAAYAKALRARPAFTKANA